MNALNLHWRYFASLEEDLVSLRRYGTYRRLLGRLEFGLVVDLK